MKLRILVIAQTHQMAKIYAESIGPLFGLAIDKEIIYVTSYGRMAGYDPEYTFVHYVGPPSPGCDSLYHEALHRYRCTRLRRYRIEFN